MLYLQDLTLAFDLCNYRSGADLQRLLGHLLCFAVLFHKELQTLHCLRDELKNVRIREVKSIAKSCPKTCQGLVDQPEVLLGISVLSCQR